MESSQQIEIEITDSDGRRTRLKMKTNDSLIIGRGKDCDRIVSGDRSLSRYHFIIEINHGSVLVKDLGSSNGTFVNGRKLQKTDHTNESSMDWASLKNRDKIEAGRTTFVIHIKQSSRCRDCGMRIPAAQRKKLKSGAGTFLCNDCRDIQRLVRKKNEKKVAVPVKRQAEMKPAVKQVVEKKLKTPALRRNEAKNPADIVEALLKQVFAIPSGSKSSIPDFDSYTDMRLIGKGAFGAVYKATRISDGQQIAVKTMLQTQKSNASNLGLFKREQEIISQLKHPNIVPAYKCSSFKDLHFIEMEYISGGNLWDWMNRCEGKKLSLQQSAPIMLEVASGLAYGHTVPVTITTRKGLKQATGVVHRDMKPTNIMISEINGVMTPKISDYGLAKAFELSGLTLGALSHGDIWRGTYYYMAREHITRYMYVEPVTDVFETAASFFHMLTGRGVWPSKNPVPGVADILNSDPLRLRDIAPSLPPKLHSVFDDALTVHPKDRIQNGQEFKKELETAL